jgi:hypothetical protein
MEGREQRLLAHGFAGFIATVRGDELKYGRTTMYALNSGTAHREFWFCGGKEIEVAETLVDRGYLFWGHNKVTVGVTVEGLKALIASEAWSDILQEHSVEDIREAAAEILGRGLKSVQEVHALLGESGIETTLGPCSVWLTAGSQKGR